MLKAKLVVVGGDAKSAEVNLKLPTIIGRGKEAGLTVPHALVSRRHTELYDRDGKLYVRDLGSLNGTFVNNTKIDGEVFLAPDQLLTLGNITFRAIYTINGNTDVPGNPETVTFEELKTVDAQLKPEKTKATESLSAAKVEQSKASSVAKPGKKQTISDIVSFDETMPVDDIPGKPKQQAKPKTPAKKITKARASKAVASKPPNGNAKLAEKKVEQNLDNPQPSANNSDDSLDLDSDIFGLGELQDQPDPVGASALDQLPGGDDEISFINSVKLDAGDGKPKSAIDSVNIDVGDDGETTDDVDDDRLASFINKLP